MPRIPRICAIAALLLVPAAAGADAWIVRKAPDVPEQALLHGLGSPRVLARAGSAPLLLLDLPARPRRARGLLWAERDAGLEASDVSASGGTWITPVQRSALGDPDLQNQPAFQQTNIAGLQSLTDGTGVLVAVIDSGVAFSHPDSSLTDRLLPGWDYVENDADPTDAHGHGTRMTGLILGVVPGAQILPLRILDDHALGTTFVLADAITYAVDAGADVINLSLGGPVDSQAVRDAIAYATSRGVIVVAAAGNTDTNTPQFPAAIPEVVAVAGIDAANVRADFAEEDDGYASCFGTHLDVSAPALGLETTSWPDDFVAVDGTSGATALVAGVLAAGRAQGKSAADAEADMVGTAVNVDAANPGYEGLLGEGRVDAGAAVQ